MRSSIVIGNPASRISGTEEQGGVWAQDQRLKNGRLQSPCLAQLFIILVYSFQCLPSLLPNSDNP
uniref:Uncharacterized protein n=1 Tax=Macaca fascicularis TaxID=9541 RepID=A0A7N9DF59_MACFA